MDQRTDSGLEFVLDNRKLIVGFFLLIGVCGAFFVIGFVEGKRQVVGLEARVMSSPLAQPQQNAATTAAPAAGAKPDEERSVREQLDWYKRVNKDAGATKGLEPAPEPVKTVVQPSSSAPAAREAPAKPKASEPKAVARQTYSVQVGAFRQRHEAEAKASLLKSKGYEYVIESPAAANTLFLLKVGKFNSRAEAVAVQLRLKKDGVGSFIKTNP